METVILNRYKNISALNYLFSTFFGFKIEFCDVTPDFGDLDFQCSLNLSGTLNDTDIYLDLYYLFDSEQRMVITEYGLDAEYNLKGFATTNGSLAVAGNSSVYPSIA